MKTELKRVKLSEIQIHPVAQKELQAAILGKIRSNFVMAAIGVLHVCVYERNGVMGMWCIDGQHRIVVMRDLGHTNALVWVHVHTDVTTDAQASERFLQLQLRGVSRAHDTYRNELTAGFPVAVSVNEVTQSLGLIVSRDGGDNCVRAVHSLKQICAKHGREVLRKTLSAAIASWGRKEGAFEGSLLSGLSMLFGKYNGQIDEAGLARRLAKYPGGASGVVGKARLIKSIHTNRSMGKCVAEIVLGEYNKGRSSNQLDPI